MSDLNNPLGQGGPSYTPASFEKRTVAWVGVVYMLMLTAAMTYLISTGKVLTGIAPLLLPPAAVGAAVIVIHRQRTGASSNRYFTFAMFFLCVAGFLMGLALGLPGLLANFGLFLETPSVTLP
jgi:4-hydroxybenzoate polyprenyltransferase